MTYSACLSRDGLVIPTRPLQNYCNTVASSRVAGVGSYPSPWQQYKRVRAGTVEDSEREVCFRLG